MVLYQADAMLGRLAARSVEWAVTDLWPGTVTDMLALLGEIRVAEPAHADGYLSRLARLPSALDAIADRHRAGMAAGRTPVRHQVDAMVARLPTVPKTSRVMSASSISSPKRSSSML